MNTEHIKDIKIVMHDQYEGEGKLIGNDYYIPYSLIEKAYLTVHQFITKENVLKIDITKTRLFEMLKYDHRGNYLHYDKNKVENWNVKMDVNGIPQTIYPFGTYYNPATIGFFGLQHYSIYLSNKNEDNKQKFLKAADWFLQNQDNSGGWNYSFDFHYYPSRLKKLKGPWYSAIGMGVALSVLSRAAYVMNDKKYLISALKAKKIFETPSRANGILATFEGKYSFYEECPTNPPSYILNGFMYSLLGLYDLYISTGDRSVNKLYQNGIVTLKRMLPLYDLGNRTAYDLTHYTTEGGYPNVAKWGYHITHIYQLNALNSIENDKKMAETLLRWKDYLIGKIKYV
ncbi:D-glucuronyl C5-epimerase family protein [Robertmurraya sp. DFI.2.37]|uniref:D-glucuronyl C5-epimerase family protein n=1 Tax=Robertmurraya sp. DFI.2.37 TaxID=3031819 RepID=UPI00177E9683|nr:D-glucuronyl C5-epimerase family protein [Robertmurraya sp. DFI.2.37]MDF1507105.1 D-glucuronyl C5-epimerase family protein [Robertmurraya sp. DFI.2.37]